MPDKLIANNAQVYIGGAAAAAADADESVAANWALVAGLMDTNLPQRSSTKVPLSDRDSDWMASRPGMKDPGTQALNLNWDPKDPLHGYATGTLNAMQSAGDTALFRIVVPNTESRVRKRNLRGISLTLCGTRTPAGCRTFKRLCRMTGH